MNQSFWSDKRVLITGHTGFKGTWLSTWLARVGANVTGFALPPDTEPSMYAMVRDRVPITSIDGDLRALQDVEDAVRRADPEIVVHMGAQALVRRGYQDPVATFATNVSGTVHLLDAIHRLAKPEAVVIVTTDKCYENKEWYWPYREDDTLGGYDPYSSSKACTELVTAAYRSSFYRNRGCGLASGRAGNVIGGGDWSADRLVPDLVKSFEVGTPALLRNPKAIRPWQHVLDALSGYMLLAENLASSPETFGQAWNFGPNEESIATVEQVANNAALKWSESACWTLDETANPHETHLLKLDSSKAKAALGWQPKLDLAMAVDWTIGWYKAANTGKDITDLTFDQIDAYSNLEQNP